MKSNYRAKRRILTSYKPFVFSKKGELAIGVPASNRPDLAALSRCGGFQPIQKGERRKRRRVPHFSRQLREVGIFSPVDDFTNKKESPDSQSGLGLGKIPDAVP